MDDQFKFDDEETASKKFNYLKSWFNSLNKNQRLVFYLICAVVALNLILAVCLSATKSRASVRLEFVSGENKTSLVALNSSAKTGVVKNGQTAEYKFTEVQRAIINDYFKETENAALMLRFRFDNNDKASLTDYDSFRFGFLLSEDFNKKGRLKNQNFIGKDRIAVSGKLKEAPVFFDLSLAMNIDEQASLPEGFFITSTKKLKLEGCAVVPCQLGFDRSTEVPFYGFASNGGIVDFNCSSFDFSGGRYVFQIQNTVSRLMPEYEIKLASDESLKSTSEKTCRTTVNFGSTKLRIKNVKNTDSLIIPSGSIASPFCKADFFTNDKIITGIILRQSPQLKEPEDYSLLGIKIDPWLVLDYPKENWRRRDFEVFTWDRYSNILIFDTFDYDVQDRLFRRLAYFVEKAGFKGTLLTNEQLEGRHGYNAHDYSAQSLANFFNKATEQNFTLNSEEELLKQILIRNGLLQQDGVYVKALSGGIASISQESTPGLRYSLFAHEGWHTIYFTNEDFRNFVSAVYYTMDKDCVQFLLDYFASQPGLGYDQTDDYLIHNEFMAYIMQNTLDNVANYFVHTASRGSVMAATPELSAYIRDTNARGFEDAAIMLQDFVFEKFGIVCGNIGLVQRLN